ncbi:hypothetical protein EDC02_2191 [Micromonospora sp. Llam0]|uniref:hypothetical protein n=1 Tax=Micromonospora sp. Llam0 TaxID=2485143 RepID=UPI000FB54328|nr:hypothetical protein [Micromonospora sp. Llam0]ROO60330.1 hypothetical protein EDC02_2191 [Micromonospora sp. Llam0]
MPEMFALPWNVPLSADLHLGQAVHVNARAAWLPATVTSITHTRIGIAYLTHQRPISPLVPAVAPWVVRPADGVRLQPVHKLRIGDVAVTFDGTPLAIDHVWQSRSGWWVIDYTDGDRAAVPPKAILRLTDPTPTVTVNGLPL